MLRKAAFILICTILIALIGGCSFANKNTDASIIPIGNEGELRPIDEKEYKGVSTQADRRLIITKLMKENGLPAICAEPFPEGTAALNIFLKRESAAKDAKTEVSFKEEDQYSREVGLPFQTHPAVKFYRDGVFALCQAALNGWVTVKDEKTPSDKLLELSSRGYDIKTFFSNTDMSVESLLNIRLLFEDRNFDTQLLLEVV